MASLKTLLLLPPGWKLVRQSHSPDGISLNLRATRKTAHCTECMKRTRSVHSYRRRRLQHLPRAGQTLYLSFAIRHW